MTKIITKSAKETKKFAEKLAKKILKNNEKKPLKNAVVIGLFGDLGAGKTIFSQGFARALGISKNLTSPTFVIIKKYRLPKITRYNLIHIDAYRLQNPKELLDLGWNKFVKNPQNIILVEWADKIKAILPKNYTQIKLKVVGESERRISINA